MFDETTHRAALILHGAIHEDDEDGMTCDESRCDAHAAGGQWGIQYMKRRLSASH